MRFPHIYLVRNILRAGAANAEKCKTLRRAGTRSPIESRCCSSSPVSSAARGIKFDLVWSSLSGFVLPCSTLIGSKTLSDSREKEVISLDFFNSCPRREFDCLKFHGSLKSENIWKFCIINERIFECSNVQYFNADVQTDSNFLF